MRVVGNLLDGSLDVGIGVLQLLDGDRVGLPDLALSGVEKLVDNVVQGMWVDLSEPFLHGGVEGITTRHLLPQAVVDDIGGGVPADEDVENLGQVTRSLVPVTLQT